MSYTTGEIAKLCGVTVRTVQFYDREGLLVPDGYSEGGRRLYGEQGLKNLQIICMYKNLGFSLCEIKKVLSEGFGTEALSVILEEREKTLSNEIEAKLSQRNAIKIVRRQMTEGNALDPNIYGDIRKIMEGRKKLKITYFVMTLISVLCLCAETCAVILWAVKGWWIPFAAIMPCVVTALAVIITIYYKNTAYICKSCAKKFKPKFIKMFFAPHTPKTRKLKCPYCGCNAYQIETYSD